MKEPVYWQTAYARFSRALFLSLSSFLPTSLPPTSPLSLSALALRAFSPFLFAFSSFAFHHLRLGHVDAQSFSLSNELPSLPVSFVLYAHRGEHRRREREREKTVEAGERVARASYRGTEREPCRACVLASARENPAAYRSLFLAASCVTAARARLPLSLPLSLSLPPPSLPSLPPSSPPPSSLTPRLFRSTPSFCFSLSLSPSPPSSSLRYSRSVSI